MLSHFLSFLYHSSYSCLIQIERNWRWFIVRKLGVFLFALPMVFESCTLSYFLIFDLIFFFYGASTSYIIPELWIKYSLYFFHYLINFVVKKRIRAQLSRSRQLDMFFYSPKITRVFLTQFFFKDLNYNNMLSGYFLR